MTKIKLAILAFAFLLTGAELFAQTKTITGTVKDPTGMPLPGASVAVIGTNKGASTDFDGMFSIDGVANSDKLLITYVGFVEQELNVGSQTTFDITLEESAEALEDVVVVAYGSQSRTKVTGAISTVDSESIDALPVTNAEQALQGRAPGVTVTNAGAPGTTPNVRIRGLGTFGNNDPLYVIDGVIVGNLSGISPSDIESVSILKDASTTALYGSLGSNGVVLVTTKKGKQGRGTLTFNAYSGFQTIHKRYDILNTDQYLQFASDVGVNINRPDDFLNNYTDFQDAIFQSGVIQNYNAAYSGGNENGTYRFSASYQDQEGAIINSGFERFSFRATSNFTLGNFKMGETMSVAFGRTKPILESGGRSLIEHAIKVAPYLNIYNDNNLGGFQGPNSAADGQDAENPVRVQTISDFETKNISVIGNVYAEYELLDGLSFRSQVGLDFFNGLTNQFTPAFNDDDISGTTHFQNFAFAFRGNSRGQAITFDNSLSYKKTFNDVHNFEALALIEDYNSKTENFSAEARNTISSDIKELGNEQQAASSSTFENNRFSYLARVNYDYDDKYIISASFRRDASSRFGANNRWGNFPSVSAGWNIAKENFLDNSNFNTLKLRASYGIVGNDRIDDYAYAPTLFSPFVYPIDDAAAIGTTPNGLPNPDLKWEETSILNLGVDFAAFNNQFTASVEYYKNKSDDLLVPVLLVPSLGYSSDTQFRNAGSVETRGVELALGYNDYDGDFTWSANVNIGTSTNEVLNLGGNSEQFFGDGFEGQQIVRAQPGESLFHFYGLVTDGIYQDQAEINEVFTSNPDPEGIAPGDIRFVDTNGDGTINSADRQIIGNPYPDLTYGLNFDARYKNFDFNLFINGVAGNDIYNTNIYDLQGMTRLFNAGVEVLDRWTPTNPSNTIPRYAGATQNVGVSDRFVEDGSYARLKNLSIGYTFDEEVIDFIQRLRVYVSGQNLITLTNYSGLDPEVVSRAGEVGLDRGDYPQPVSFLLGLELSF
ncbi:TonB-linked SusC/RagA family outer membrane protein [Leeuwenhoekiella aestuarii]|uniref:TonB-linked SusC/RagA family outer membrane protein n=1 Tax=Leeuwenhoekiella aestuarii TaxID=2249426 RepID=A0A4Q0NPA0_9FLAO|nr:TonB-dependent receptor [Leeuwenhoekiella aestuarii]RXG12011.1 TonB-linked SusC/RagA family outer membrane protein [Leeuwenhoekiella aestuarii]RXG13569.1 TonB-linked SusC/RagA family outer membrane protein [Leeuwenhoekiella aestuarii]